jgi:molybdenum cofactor cytidylyltransferase
MGGRNKLLERIDGTSVIVHVVQTVLSVTGPVVVVTGYQQREVRNELRAFPVELAHNPRCQAGMSTSLAVGVAALEGRVGGALICLGDMPRVLPDDLHALVHAFCAGARDPAAAYVPVHDGRQGNPVLWTAARFSELKSLSGDRGAKALLNELKDPIVRVPASAGVLVDADTPNALEQLRGEER